MDINIFDLSNYKVPYFYERQLSSFTYSFEEWKMETNNFGQRFNFPIDEFPWGEKRNSDKSRAFKSKTTELFSEEVLGTVPIRLQFSYYSDNIIEKKIIDYSWEEFRSKINLTRHKAKLIGRLECFDSILQFPKDQLSSKIISEMPESGFAKNVILRVKEIYQNFSENKKFPIFMDTVSSTGDQKFLLRPSLSFCELLINDQYFSNSPVDIIFSGQGILEHNIGDVDVPTVEKLSNYIIKKLKFSKNKIKTNIFIDRCDNITWKMNQSVFDDKSYYIRDIKIFEKKDNYYEDLLIKIREYKKIYDTIIEYKPDVDELDLDDCKLLLDEIIKL